MIQPSCNTKHWSFEPDREEKNQQHRHEDAEEAYSYLLRLLSSGLAIEIFIDTYQSSRVHECR